MIKILLVEDDKSLREIYGVRLLAEGYDIVSAGDGEEALAMAIRERPDLILSDVMMPKISGFDMLDILRSTAETKDIKVIMMTALSSDDQRERGEKLGADRYLVKSQVGIEDVVATVHDVLGDMPNTSQSSANTFATPAPTAAQPDMTTPTITATAPQPVLEPIPEVATPVAQTEPAPAPTAQAPEAVAAPQPENLAAPQPAMPAPAPQPAPPQAAEPAPTPIFTPTAPQSSESVLPQPTAPFSTPRPSGLGDRVINPVETPQSETDIASQMEQELSALSQQLQSSEAEVAATQQQANPQPVQAPQPAMPTPPPMQVGEPISAPVAPVFEQPNQST